MHYSLIYLTYDLISNLSHICITLWSISQMPYSLIYLTDAFLSDLSQMIYSLIYLSDDLLWSISQMPYLLIYLTDDLLWSISQMPYPSDLSYRWLTLIYLSDAIPYYLTDDLLFWSISQKIYSSDLSHRWFTLWSISQIIYSLIYLTDDILSDLSHRWLMHLNSIMLRLFNACHIKKWWGRQTGNFYKHPTPSSIFNYYPPPWPHRVGF